MSKDDKSLADKDKEEGTHPPGRSIRLKNAFDINRFLGKVINELYRDKMSPQKAGKLGFLCNVMLHSLETQDFEKRLEKVERVISERGQ